MPKANEELDQHGYTAAPAIIRKPLLYQEVTMTSLKSRVTTSLLQFVIENIHLQFCISLDFTQFGFKFCMNAYE